jgi:hypothetical protein
MRVVLDNLLVLTGVPVESRQQRHVHLPEAAQEAARQVRAAAKGALGRDSNRPRASGGSRSVRRRSSCA